MRICDDLRQAVLQAAIQGKLTKQLPEDGNAVDLLKKGLSLANNEEESFEIPSSWVWAKLGDIGSFTRGSGIKKNEVTLEGYPCIRYGQLYTTYHNIINEVQSKTTETVFKKSKKIKHGDVVMALTGENNYDIALASAYIGYDTVAMGGDMTVFTHNVNPLYLVIAINSPYGIKCKSKLATGNIIVHISNDKLASISIPLPPLAEQQRIVAKVEELMARIDDLEKTENELEKLKAAFPGDMKAALLQAAMQGKLTEQLPEDGDAADLINQIAKEKDQLIKEGKIKKEKPLPEITTEELPFDIPENWVWCNFNSLFTVFNGDRGKNYPSKATLQTTGDIPFISAINLNGKNVSVDDKLLYVSADQYDKLRAGKLMKNDMVMCIRGSLGKHGRFQFNKGAIASSLVIIRPINETYVDSDYLSIYLDSPLLFSEIRRFDNGTAQPNLAAESLKKFMFPLPPLAEQKRIVEKLDKLLPLCDGLVEE